VYKRSMDGQGVDARMAQTRDAYRDVASRAWALASG
jgi:hypothetical protein